MSAPRINVLFVCTGNICRSPTAEGVFRKMAEAEGLGEQISVDSAGTYAFHSGELPDRRARAAAEKRGYSLDDLRARRIVESDFEHFDYVIAMDDEHVMILRELAEGSDQQKIKLFLEFASDTELREVPDPYYGGAAGFERVLDLVEDASKGLLARIRESL